MMYFENVTVMNAFEVKQLCDSGKINSFSVVPSGNGRGVYAYFTRNNDFNPSIALGYRDFYSSNSGDLRMFKSTRSLFAFVTKRIGVLNLSFHF